LQIIQAWLVQRLAVELPHLMLYWRLEMGWLRWSR